MKALTPAEVTQLLTEKAQQQQVPSFTATYCRLAERTGYALLPDGRELRRDDHDAWWLHEGSRDDGKELMIYG